MGIVQVYKQEILITKFRFFTFIDIISIIIIQVYALILAHSAWIAPITAADETWLPLHNYFLQGTIFTALLCLARQIPLIRCIWIGWLVGYLSTEIDLLDGALHGLLAQTGIYRFVGNATFEQNPQYGIITMALVVIFSILLQLSFRKFRRLSLVMGAVYLLIQFTIAFVNHKIYPSGIMKDVIQERAALVMSSKNLDKKNFRFFCETHLLGCRTKANGQIK